MNELQITSPVFPHNGMIPSKFTCDGADVSPTLSIANIPEKSRSLALIVDEPDAPAGTWVHWVVWNIGAGTKEIPEDSVPLGAMANPAPISVNAGGGDDRNPNESFPCDSLGGHDIFPVHRLLSVY